MSSLLKKENETGKEMEIAVASCALLGNSPNTVT